MGIPLVFVFISVPILQVIETLQLDYEESPAHVVLQEASEALFMIDLFLSFLKVPPEMTEPTLKKTAKLYLHRFFMIDFLATVPGQVIYLFPSMRTIYYILTYFRVVRIRKLP